MARRRYYRFQPWMLNGRPGNVSWAVKRVIVRGVNHGLVVTSTTGGTHASTSYHYSGRAVDMAGAGTAAEIDFQRDLIRGLGAWRFNEIFGPDNFANVKNGTVITLVEGTPLEQMHDTHIHVAPRLIPKLKIPRWFKDRRRARKLRAAGAKWPLWIIRESRKARVPLAWALALVDQETGFRNIFGADQSSKQLVALHHKAVTRARVARLLRWVADGGHSNGVGPGQLTSVGYIRRAQRAGGAHRPKINLRVSFEVFREKTGGDFGSKAWLYNGSPAYQDRIEAKQRKWKKVLT